jgi:CTP:molybdopterin cytidylyltransferase MocA
MKQALLITSAGLSTRFSKSVGHDVLKITYHEGEPKRSLLGFQLDMANQLELAPIILVVGYRSSEVRDFVSTYYPGREITIVENTRYRDWGTCYSFVLGVEKARQMGVDDLVYMEGDLVVDRYSMQKLLSTDGNAISSNGELITGASSVAFYVAENGLLHYVYDTRHRALHIPEPFTILGNSGQVWKFSDTGQLYGVTGSLDETELAGTNLIPIERYFQRVGTQDTTWVQFDNWVNCNEVSDYRNALAVMKEQDVDDGHKR